MVDQEPQEIEPGETEPGERDIEGRLNYLEEANRWILEALGMVSSLSDFHATLSGRKGRPSPQDILAETRLRLKRLFSFETMAFFLINEEDQDFELIDFEPEGDKDKLQKEADRLIEDGTFA